MAKSLYLIDGHAQIYRAYYAPFGQLTSPSGEPTRATHVFCQMLLNLIRDRRPDYLVMVMDTSDETVFRRDIYPAYKAQREPPPEDLPVQADRIVSILEAAGIPILRKERYEADDIIATLVRQYAGEEVHTYVVSRDKDLEQLLSDRVTMFDPLKGVEITAAGLLALKGWTPAQAIDAQVLTGDTVDNVPGVAGIGPKTAAKLLQKYGSAAEVIAHADELTRKQRENVLAFAPKLALTRELVTLCSEVPISLDLSAAACERFDWGAVAREFRSLGFRRLLEQLPDGAGDGIEGGERGDGDAGDGGTSERGDAVEAAAELREPEGGTYELIDTPEELSALAAALERVDAFALDTETTGLVAMDAELVGLSFSWEVGRGCYVPVRSSYGEPLGGDLVREALGPVLRGGGALKVGQNLKYDMLVLRNAGMPVGGPLFDTMIAAFLVEPARGSYGLDRMARDMLGHEMIPITELIGKGKQQLRMDQVPLEHIAEYAAEDADYTWRLYRLFEPRLAPLGLGKLFYEVEMPLLAVLTEMEQHGVSLDVGYLAEVGERLARRAAALVDKVHAAAGMVFNLDSPKQLGEVLFDKLGYRVVRKTKTTRSTDADTLTTLANETGDALPKLLLEYRELQKLRGTYVDALPLARSKRTGRVHTSYHQIGAVTGRLSSSEPNLQNIPIRTELGRQVRRAFVPRSSEEVLIVADYSQIELRVLGHFCEDEGLLQAFRDELDIHAVVAAEVNGVSLEAVTREMRGQAKAVNFGIIYGQTAFGLSQATGMSRGDAQAFIDRYDERFPRIRAFTQQCVADAKRDGYVRTLLGRRRPIAAIDSRNRTLRAQAERLAINTVVQGSAADLIKLAMIRLHERVEAGLRLRMLLQVHDELVCEAAKSEAEDVAGVIREVMEGAMSLRVPLRVEVGIGPNWLEAK